MASTVEQGGPAAAPASPIAAAGPVFARDRILALPVLAIVLVVVLTAALLTMVARDQRLEARQKLTSDALWVEQYLRFQLMNFEGELDALAKEVGRRPVDDAAQAARVEHVVSLNAEVLGMVWADGDGAVRMAVPPGAAHSHDAGLAARAAERGRPVFSAAREAASGAVVDIVAPVYVPGGPPQSLWMTVSLDSFLARNVPWWIAGNYQVAVTDAGGRPLAAKSTIAPPADGETHTISIDPPLPGLYVTLSPYAARIAYGQIAVTAAILGLLALVVVNLWVVQRQGRRRAAAERALRTEYAFRKAMEDSLTIGMRARGRDGRILYVNPEFCRMVGRAREDLIGRGPPHAYWAPDAVEAGLRRQADLLGQATTPQRFETRFQRPDGTLVDALVYEAPLIGADGVQIGWMGSVIDITDRKRAEEEKATEAERLQHAARLVTLGEMASTLAHELNQPLAAITSYATGSLNLLERAPSVDAAITATMTKLVAQAQRAGAILKRVQEFARKRAASFSEVDLRTVVQDTLAFSGDDLGKRGARIALSMPETPVLVQADPVLIEQALLNLIRNAVEATQARAAGERLVAVSLLAEGAEAGLSVTDNGPGMSADEVRQAFAPFATTKPEGMGLGLPICRSILELHKGQLRHETPEAGGSRFVMTLPLVAARPRETVS